MILWQAVIEGEPYSKANSRLNMIRGGRVVSYKNAQSQKYVQGAILQMAATKPREPLLGDLTITARIYYASRRKDLDPSLVFDCLQKAGVVKNDRSFREQHIFWHLDPERPRTEIWIEGRT